MHRLRADPRRIAPTALAAALALVYLLWQPPSLDLAAAEYRAWLFGHADFAIWDLRWYGGHHLPGYSVLAPALGSLLGPRLVGALAAVAAAALFERIAFDRFGRGAWLGSLWFAAGTATCLLSGRITFALGLVPALAALLALERARATRTSDQDRRRLLAVACGLAAITPLASPVAALFLALAGTAYGLAERDRSGLALAACALAPVGAMAIAFPEGGSEPFAFSAFWPVVAVAAVALALLPREQRTLRTGVVLYALLTIAVFAIATPIGGNAVRLGALCAGPVAALALWPRRGVALALVAPALLFWQWTAAVRDVATASGDPSVEAAYYAPLLAQLERAGGPIGRVEIPFTHVHWEARWVAPHTALARGWERQLDREVNAVFYEGTLTPARYRAWLGRNAVRWVALPDVPLDDSAEAEARLIRRGLPYLQETWSNGDWRLFAVRNPTPLADPPARVTAFGPDTVDVSLPRSGADAEHDVLLRVRWTPYWAVVGGDACVSAAGDYTRIEARGTGTIRLAARFSPTRIGARDARCTPTRG